jgi:uncharacterized beta-barrel protein YwiB (DUF1934 family)
MKKDVLLSIAAAQYMEGFEPEFVNLMTQAKLYERNGKYYIVYEESELTGMEGTRTTVKMDNGTVILMRTGAFRSELLFAKDQRHVGLYETGVGTMVITTHTSSLENTIGEDGGKLVIEYTLEIDNSLLGHNHLHMVVTPAQVGILD